MPSADKLYRKILTSALVKSKFFSRGWGDVEAYQALLRLRKAITSREECNELIYSCSPDVSLQKVRLVNSFIIQLYTRTSSSCLIACTICTSATLDLLGPSTFECGHSDIQ